jgi:hypothetical protein
MNRTKGLILVSLLVIGVALTSSTIILSALADNQGTAPDPQVPSREPPWMSQLTDTQKQEIQQLMDSLRQSGATPQEIRDAVDVKLQGWGIELPKDKGKQPQAPWMSQLTDDQKAQIKQLLDSLNETGATPQETRDAVNAKLQEWGIQLPELSAGQPTNSTLQPRDPPWMSQLTDDQKAQIQQLMDSLRQSGATPQEMRDAIDAKLQEWGIEVPAPPQILGQ